METISCTTVVVDDTGQIVALDKLDGRFGLTPDVAGQPWDQAFEGWDLPSVPLADSGCGPQQTFITAPNGEALSVEIIPVPAREGSRQTAVLFRSAFGNSLTERQQQLCGLGEISADVAHEINNALTLLLGWLELLMADHGTNKQLASTLQLLQGESNRIAQLTRNLLDIARGNGRSLRDSSLSQLIDEVVALVRYEMQSSNIELESRCAEELPRVHGNSGRLKQAMLNLLLNARQAMPSGGKVVVSAEPDAAGGVSLAVADTGCGISEEAKSRVFSPFFTTKRNGTGLGLSVTRKIVEDHGGTMRIESKPGEGARFTLRFPMATT